MEQIKLKFDVPIFFEDNFFRCEKCDYKDPQFMAVANHWYRAHSIAFLKKVTYLDKSYKELQETYQGHHLV